jgi:hypothetical protein
MKRHLAWGLLLFSLAALGGCEREPGIIVNIAAWPVGAERIRVRTTIEGTLGTDIFLNKDLSRFAVRVPAGSQGTVQLDASGLDLLGCKLATGTLNEPVPDNLNRFVERTIVLSTLPSPICVLAHSTPFPVGIEPDAVAVGDFNGDTLSDIAVANSASDTVSVLLGDAINGLVPADPLPFPVGSTPNSVAVGDFDGDKKTDLAVALANSNLVMVRLGNGMGGFVPISIPVAVGRQPTSVVVGDFNRDMKLDLAVANVSDSNLSVLLGNGTGGFGIAATYGAGAGPSSLAVGDLNGDMKPDLVVTNSYGTTVSVLLGNGEGGFSMAASFAAGTQPKSVAIGDFNGDMKPDLAVANFTSSDVSVLLGNGVGDFGVATNLPFGPNPYSLAVGDFNGDGLPDIATANYGGNTASVGLSNGLGGLGPAVNFPVGLNPIALAVGYFDAGKMPDLVVANFSDRNVSILLNQF